MYRCFPFENEQDRFCRAQHIFQIFMQPNSILEVNLEEKLVSKIKENILACQHSKHHMKNLDILFSEAQRDAFVLLMGIYPRWITSKSYNCMLLDLNLTDTIHFRSTRQIAASRLLEFFELERRSAEASALHSEKQINNQPKAFFDSSGSFSSQEYQTFYWLCNAFSKNEIGLEFVE